MPARAPTKIIEKIQIFALAHSIPPSVCQCECDVDDGVGIHRLAFLLRGPEANLARGGFVRCCPDRTQVPAPRAPPSLHPTPRKSTCSSTSPSIFFERASSVYSGFGLKRISTGLEFETAAVCFTLGPAITVVLVGKCPLLHGAVAPRAACSDCNTVAKSGAGHDALRALCASGSVALPRASAACRSRQNWRCSDSYRSCRWRALRRDRQIRRSALPRAASSKSGSRNCQAKSAD